MDDSGDQEADAEQTTESVATTEQTTESVAAL
jgi:hypothetical protein